MRSVVLSVKPSAYFADFFTVNAHLTETGQGFTLTMDFSNL